MTATDELRRMLDERGVKWWPMHDDEAGYHEDRDTEFLVYGCKHVAHEWGCRLQVDMLTPEQAIAATLGRHRAKSHPYGYERDTGAYDCTRCECGCINDISATYCNDCGGEIEIDESAEKEYYDWYGKRTVFAVKHDDGSLEFCERRYVPEDAAMLGRGECVPHGEWKSISQSQEVRRVFCDCGYELGMDERDSWPFKSTRLFAMPNYCQECGRKIRKAVKR